MRDLAARSGGHAVLFRATDKAGGAFAALSPPLARIHHAVKASFDPHRIFNPGRLYPEL
jgi:glycolate oxidase FAD binding subunit